MIFGFDALRIALALVLAGGGFAAAWQVQSWRYEKQINELVAQQAKAIQVAEASARAREREFQNRADQISRDAAKRQQITADRAATTELVSRGLRDDITRLNARPTPGNPEAARLANDATRARELLGACADRYRSVAQAADGLRDQVTGLQSYARGLTTE